MFTSVGTEKTLCKWLLNVFKIQISLQEVIIISLSMFCCLNVMNTLIKGQPS